MSQLHVKATPTGTEQPTSRIRPPRPRTSLLHSDLLLQVAQAYREMCRGVGAVLPPLPDPAQPPDQRSTCSQLFHDLHQDLPEAAFRLADGLLELPRVGDNFLDFHLQEELGRGAFGRVFLARQPQLANRWVVLKVTTMNLGEPDSLARLQHTHIVPVYSVHFRETHQALCMPYLGPATLADFLEDQNDRPLPKTGAALSSYLARRPRPACLGPGRPGGGDGFLRQLERQSYVTAVLSLGQRLADALAHAHDQRIVHNDLKPANVLLTDQGLPMLMDFNLAADAAAPAGLATATVGGTLPYMAPEHLRAFQEVRTHADPRSDLYSLGLVLYELLANRPPWPLSLGGRQEEEVSRLLADRVAPPPDVTLWNPAVTPAAAAIVRRCLAPDPEDRYQTAHQLREDLERQLQDRPLRFAPDVSPAERARKFGRRHPRLAPAAALVAALLMGLISLGLLLARNHQLDRFRAREELRGLDRDLRQAQVRLYDQNADPRQLQTSLAHAREALARYGVLDDPAWLTRPAVGALAPEELERLRDQAGELLFLLARTTQILATPGRDAELLREALRLNRLAADTYGPGRAPRAVWEQQADLAQGAGDLVTAQAARDRAAATPPRPDRDPHLRGHRLALARQFRAALPLLAEATRADPGNFAAWFVRGNCLFELGQAERAIGCFSTCTALRPDFPWAWVNRGLAYLHLRTYAEAAEDFDRALELVPDLAKARFNRALAREGLGRYAEAADDVTAVLCREPHNYLFLLRARLREAAGDTAGAAADRAEAFRHPPADALGWVTVAKARLAQDPAGALDALDAALQLDPWNYEALQNKAALLSDKFHKDVEALAVSDRTVALYPDSVLAVGGRAVLRARLGQPAGAREDAARALALDSQPPTLYQVACVHALLARQTPEDRFRALELLAAALRGGFGLDMVDTDTDLDPIRKEPAFRQAVQAARELARPARN